MQSVKLFTQSVQLFESVQSVKLFVQSVKLFDMQLVQISETSKLKQCIYCLRSVGGTFYS